MVCLLADRISQSHAHFADRPADSIHYRRTIRSLSRDPRCDAPPGSKRPRLTDKNARPIGLAGRLAKHQRGGDAHRQTRREKKSPYAAVRRALIRSDVIWIVAFQRTISSSPAPLPLIVHSLACFVVVHWQVQFYVETSSTALFNVDVVGTDRWHDENWAAAATAAASACWNDNSASRWRCVIVRVVWAHQGSNPGPAD